MQDSELMDENTLGAFVDGQLDSAGCEAVMVAMARDPAVRERVERLRRAKDLMRVGFASAQPPSRRAPLSGAPVASRLSRALAASVAALALGLAAGSLGYHYGRHLDRSELASLPSPQRQQSDRIVLHISEANPIQFAAALSYADRFLRRHPAPDSRVEVIANAGGLDMMRTGLSPYEDQIGALLEAHPNIRFLACANAIANLRKQGIEPHLIDSIDTEKKAIDHIVARLQEGWSYVRVDALPEI